MAQPDSSKAGAEADRAPQAGAEIRQFPSARDRAQMTERIEQPGPIHGASEPRERTVTLAALIAFLLALVGGGVWLMSTLRDVSRLQDCAMQGRRNCAPIEVPARER
jgi:hypothetical protein